MCTLKQASGIRLNPFVMKKLLRTNTFHESALCEKRWPRIKLNSDKYKRYIHIYIYMHLHNDKSNYTCKVTYVDYYVRFCFIKSFD